MIMYDCLGVPGGRERGGGAHSWAGTICVGSSADGSHVCEHSCVRPCYFVSRRQIYVLTSPPTRSHVQKQTRKELECPNVLCNAACKLSVQNTKCSGVMGGHVVTGHKWCSC
jgi:hypothetical protein